MGVLFLHDNATAHKASITMQKLTDIKLEILHHPPYLPDLTPGDYHLFPNLKKHLKGTDFSAREDVIAGCS